MNTILSMKRKIKATLNMYFISQDLVIQFSLYSASCQVTPSTKCERTPTQRWAHWQHRFILTGGPSLKRIPTSPLSKSIVTNSQRRSGPMLEDWWLMLWRWRWEILFWIYFPPCLPSLGKFNIALLSLGDIAFISHSSANRGFITKECSC